jgi:YgiT-type zinc finger domain-containing protein
MKSMECVICKHGSTHEGKVTVTLERNEAIVLIKQVPAQICDNCGHYYLSAEIAQSVMKRGESALQRGQNWRF